MRHVWGVVHSGVNAEGGAPALVSQHGTHVTLRLVSFPPPSPSLSPPHLHEWRWRVVLEIGYDPVFGVHPWVACRGPEPDGAQTNLRKMSDVQGGAYLELRVAAAAGAPPDDDGVDVVVPLATGTLDLGFESAGQLPPPPSRECPPTLHLRLPPPFHLQPPPPTPAFAYRALLLDVARHFHPVNDVMWLIDRIADLRLNVLHLHLTDDSGWRVHIDR